jgi:hypothetical protein
VIGFTRQKRILRKSRSKRGESFARKACFAPRKLRYYARFEHTDSLHIVALISYQQSRRRFFIRQAITRLEKQYA